MHRYTGMTLGSRGTRLDGLGNICIQAYEASLFLGLNLVDSISEFRCCL